MSYKLFSFEIGNIPLCNKKRERAPVVNNLCFVLCWRCTGLVIGGISGELLFRSATFWYRNHYLFIGVLAFPFLADVFLQASSIQKSNNARRVTVGVLLGIALAHFRPFL